MSADQISGRLKTWPGDLDEIFLGRKKAEIRRCDDRDFRVGQVWELFAWDPSTEKPVPRSPSVFIRITHVERLAGPLLIFGRSRLQMDLLPLAVLSFEIA